MRLMRHTPFLVLVASVSMSLIGGGVTTALAIALKPMAEDFGWPRAVPSLAYAFVYIGGGLGGILMGHVLDRWGMGPPALVSALMLGVGAILTGYVGAEWQLYLLFLIMVGGFGQGALTPPLMANIMRWYERRRGMAIGIVSSGQSLAGMIWPPVVGYLTEAESWRGAFFWVGVTILIVNLPLSCIMWKRPGAVARAAPAAPTEAPRIVTAAKPVIRPAALEAWLCVAIIGCCCAMSLPLSHLVAHLSDLGHPVSRAAEVLSLMLLASIVSRAVLLGLLCDRFGGLRALVCFSAVQASMLALMAFDHSLPMFYVIAVVYGLGYGALFPIYPVIVREYLPVETAGRRTGVVLMFGSLGMAIGAWMGGALFDLTGGYAFAFAIAVAFNLVNLAVAVLLIRRTGPRLAAAAA
jgi:MFS family permease